MLQRDVLGLKLEPGVTELCDALIFLEALAVFKLGLSWGGVTSLAVVYPALDRPGQDFDGRLVRLNIGLEAPIDLVDDLQNAILTGLK